MSNQNSSTVTTSLNTEPASTSIIDNVSNLFSNAETAVSEATERVSSAATEASERISSAAIEATERVSGAANEAVSSLTGTEEPVTRELSTLSSLPTQEPSSQEPFLQDTFSQEPFLQDTFSQDTFASTKRKRCRNGTRKDKDGNCQPKQVKQVKQTKHRKSAVKAHNMTAKYQELKLENTILIRQQKKAINITKKLMNFLTLQ